MQRFFCPVGGDTPARRLGRIAAAIALLLSTAACALPARAQDVLTHHYDFYRSGVQSMETQLTPENVRPATFGKLFSLAVDGQVYAEPLWVGNYTMADGKSHNVLFVATAHDSIYAFDADGKSPVTGYYWHVSLLEKGETTVPNGDTGTDDINPEIGIIGTPVIDRTAGVIYLVSKTKSPNGGNPTYTQRLHALDLATGKERMNGPVTIQATVNGTGDGSGGSTIQFDPLTQNERSALALAGGSVWIAWASHGDNGPYHGYVMGFNASDLSKSTGVFIATPNGSDGGIWMSGGGIAADQSGNLYVGTGNGTFDANTDGGVDYADSALKLTPMSNGKLDLATSFTPYDQDTLSTQDLDFGTSACTLIDNPSGPYPHLLVTTDKSGQIYLVDRDKMGGYHQNTNQDLQDFSDGGWDVHSSFAFFNNTLYFAPDGGPLSAWAFNPKTGLFNTTAVTAANSTFGCDGCNGSGGTPSISANGTANAVVWILDDSNYLSAPAVLHAWDPTLNTELYNSAMAANNRDQADLAVKFTTPTIANGFVYVGGASSVTVFGLLKNAPPLAAVPSFAPVPGSVNGPVSVTITSKTPGAVIHYTLNGGTPSGTSALYAKPIPITSTTTIRAVATAPGLGASNIAQAEYIIGVGGNVFTLDSGMATPDFYLNGSAKIASKRLRITDGNGNEAGSAYYRTRVHIANFATHFQFQLTDPSADGITFLVQNQGVTALGATGGMLGYGTDGTTPAISPSAAVKFDLYDNSGEGTDSTGFYTDGASPTVPAVNLANTSIDLHSGHIFAVTLRYNGARLYETITDTVTHKSASTSYAANLPGTLKASSAHAGFTGGTGGLAVIADILDWSWTVPPVEPFAVTSLAAAVSAGAPKLAPWSDAGFPNGKGVLFPANAVGQSVSFTVNVAAEATFAVSLLADTGPKRGTLQLAIDGVNVAAPFDEYGASVKALPQSFGSVLLTAGKHTFTFAVTGKNKSSRGYAATFGTLTLTP